MLKDGDHVKGRQRVNMMDPLDVESLQPPHGVSINFFPTQQGRKLSEGKAEKIP